MTKLYLLCILIFGLSLIACKDNLSQKSMHTIYLVRHAEKDITAKSNPPLTAKGTARARRLAELLEGKDIKQIYSTNYNRTLSTARPLADKLGISIQTYSPRDTVFTDKLARTKGNLLVVGHSNTIPFLVNKLLGKNVYQELEEKTEYDKLFILSSDGTNYTAKVESFEP